MQEAQMWSTVENGLKSWFHMCALTGRFAGAQPLSVDSLLKVTHHKLSLVLHPDKFWRPGDYDIDMRERTRCMANALTAKLNAIYDEWQEAYAASEWGRKDGNNQLRCFPRDYINNFGQGSLDLTQFWNAPTKAPKWTCKPMPSPD